MPPVFLPVWEDCCPLRVLSESSRLRLSTERRDWLRVPSRPLPAGWGGVSNYSRILIGQCCVTLTSRPASAMLGILCEG